jgi:hypothetical protein
MGTRKKVSKKKVSKKVLVKKLARSSSNRLALRPAAAGQPPTGTLDLAAVNKAVKAWIAITNKRSSDYCSYKQAALTWDAREMVQGREDLPLFVEKATPINGRDFDWLQLLLDALQALGDEDANRAGSVEINSENATVVMNTAVDARRALALRAEACGIPLSLFTIDRGYGDPEALYNHCARAARLARKRLEEFNNKPYALKLIDALESALDDLKPLVEGKQDLLAEGKEGVARRAALKRLLFDALTYVAPWGRDVTAGDPTKAGRYELDHIFPTKKKKDPPPVPPA